MRRELLVAGFLLGCAADSSEPGREGTDARTSDAEVAPDTLERSDGAVGAVDLGAVPDSGVAGPDTGDARVPPPPMGCLGAVVRVGDVEIFQYEASRADATAETAGVAAGGACSRPGVLPWTLLNYVEARAACAASGFSLCDGPTWQTVCTGDPPTRAWPYGQSYMPSVCNDHINGSGEIEVTGDRDGCRTPEGVFDLSGNVWEFTDEGEKRGASFKLNAVMFRQDVTSCLQTYFVLDTFADDDVGFRCCRPAP